MGRSYALSRIVAATCVMGLVASPAYATLNFYGDIGIGGYFRDLKHDSYLGATLINQSANTDWKHGRLGWSVGLDLGYHIWKQVSAEWGYFTYQNQKVTLNSATTTLAGNSLQAGSTVNFDSWGTYVAGRIDFPIEESYSVYTKLGLAYLHTAVTYNRVAEPNLSGSANTWSPLFAAGVCYKIGRNFSLSFDYSFVLGNGLRNDPLHANRLVSSDIHVPSLQRYMVNLGYQFKI